MSRTLARPPRVYVVEAICEGAFRTGDRAGSSGGPTCLTGPTSTTTLGSKPASLGGAITGGWTAGDSLEAPSGVYYIHVCSKNKTRLSNIESWGRARRLGSDPHRPEGKSHEG
jgi:hypothetical protein